MYPKIENRANPIKNLLLGSTLLAVSAGLLPSLASAQETGAQTITVTGFRASLQSSTNAKRGATAFTDSVFAEDIGKFPDTNIAESLNRVPGVTILRDNDGEGTNISVRGLGTNFTKILLNGAQVSVATTGPLDSANNNREVDLNMFPTELFTQLTVSKSSSADQIEGGGSGTVNMRSARPFDKEGPRLTYSLQGTSYSKADGPGYRGALIASDTFGPFGVLIGLTDVHSRVMTTGWESGNAGWLNPGPLTAAQCGVGNTCDQTGANGWIIPNTVPAGVTTAGLIPGSPIDAAFLTSHNPGLTTAQISNALVPRIGRDMFENGTRDRYNGIASFEFRPSDELHMYVDVIGGRTHNKENRTDSGLGARPGNGSQPLIPLNEKVDANNVVTSATFANAQFLVEARPYKEKASFFSINPGLTWTPTNLIEVDAQANYSKSHSFRHEPTYFFVTAPASQAAGIPGVAPPAGGVVATFVNPPGGEYPLITSNVDRNNPANFQWANGLARLQDDQRWTSTKGAHLDVKYGDDEINVKVGAAYDDVFRESVGIDPDQQYSNAICGNNPNVFLPPPNTQPPCQGLNSATPNPVPGGYPTYPGYGTGYSTGFPAFVWQGSGVPQSSLASFLKPGPTGFVTPDYAKLALASNLGAIETATVAAIGKPNASSTVPFYLSIGAIGAMSGLAEEKNTGFYAEVNGVFHPDHDLKYNLGVRYVKTDQAITSPSAHVNPLNAGLTDGGLYPNTFTFSVAKHKYDAFLPSINLVYNVSDNFLVRAAMSRTMTRPNIQDMISGINFVQPAADAATLGNPTLAPYFSTNTDFGAEFYTGGEGYIGVDFFRKGIAGFTVGQVTTQPFSYLAAFGITYATLTPSQQLAIDGRGGPGVATVAVTTRVNAIGNLNINGMELDLVQPLDFLLERYGLKGFGLTGNLTRIDQSSTGAVPPVAAGVAHLSYNATAYYEDHGAMVRLSYVWTGKYYKDGNSNTLNLCIPTGSQSSGCPGGAYLITRHYGQLDLSSSYQLSNLFGRLPSDPQLTFDIQNITNAKLRSYDQFTDAANTFYNQGSLYMLGLRGTF